ncbi:MAG: alpha/beta hydrolase, partial [Rhodospirillaceae bacterium]
MAHNDPSSMLAVPARNIPVPTSISPTAQAMLAASRMHLAEYPPPGATAAWREHVAAMDQAILPILRERAARVAADVEEIEVDGIRVFVATPREVAADDRAVYLDIHGGALVMGGDACCRAFAIIMAGQVKSRIWSVDYRMPPDHPYPAALDDCLTVYRALLRERRPREIIVSGGSAGGNLAA